MDRAATVWVEVVWRWPIRQLESPRGFSSLPPSYLELRLSLWPSPNIFLMVLSSVSLLLTYTFPFMSISSICLFSLAYVDYGSPLSLCTPHTPVLLLNSGVIFCTECFLLLPAGFHFFNNINCCTNNCNSLAPYYLSCYPITLHSSQQHQGPSMCLLHTTASLFVAAPPCCPTDDFSTATDQTTSTVSLPPTHIVVFRPRLYQRLEV